MAMTKCKDCQSEVSDQADACPSCGYTGIIKDRKKAEQEAVMNSPAGKATAVALICLILWGLYGCLAGSRGYDAGKENCQRKGVAYFKELGSWPTLSDGRVASDVVKQRCSNTTGAFGE